MFRDILVHVDGSDAAPARIRLALGICGASKARLTGLHVTPPADVEPVYKPSQIEAASAAMEINLTADAQMAEAAFQHETVDAMVETAWSSVYGDVAPQISHAARYTDLVMVGQYEWQGPVPMHPLPIAHTIAVHCGRPLLVVPAGFAAKELQSATIAWDGSRECVRAVHDAIPLLKRMGSVQVATIDRPVEGERRDASALIDHLARHGIKLSATAPIYPHGGEHKALLSTLAELPSDLLVMGAYSRPEWFEFLFGGATLSILTQTKSVVLLSH